MSDGETDADLTPRQREILEFVRKDRKRLVFLRAPINVTVAFAVPFLAAWGFGADAATAARVGVFGVSTIGVILLLLALLIQVAFIAWGNACDAEARAIKAREAALVALEHRAGLR